MSAVPWLCGAARRCVFSAPLEMKERILVSADPLLTAVLLVAFF